MRKVEGRRGWDRGKNSWNAGFVAQRVQWVVGWECGRETKHGINVVQLSHRRQHDSQLWDIFFLGGVGLEGGELKEGEKKSIRKGKKKMPHETRKGKKVIKKNTDKKERWSPENDR
jgi:hypothetical protein